MTKNNGDGSGGLGSVIWRWKWVLVAAIVVPAAIGIAFAMSAPPDYVSEAHLLIPASDPVTTRTTQTSSITMELRSYAQGGMRERIRSELGSRASELDSIAGDQDRTEEIYLITAHSPEASVAHDAAELGAQALIQRSNDLAGAQLTRLEEETRGTVASLTETLVGLEQQLHRVNAAVAARKHLGGPVDALVGKRARTQARISAVSARINALQATIRQATQRDVERRAATTLISPASTPKSTIAAHLVSTIGLALVVGLAAGFLTILAIEALSARRRRRRLARSRPDRLDWNGSEPLPGSRESLPESREPRESLPESRESLPQSRESREPVPESREDLPTP